MGVICSKEKQAEEKLDTKDANVGPCDGKPCCAPSKQNIRRGTSFTEHLVREQERNFQSVYDIVEIVGEGSISNIYKIRKKESAIGGSSREEFVKEVKKENKTLKGFFGIRYDKKVEQKKNSLILGDASSNSNVKNGVPEKNTSNTVFFALKEIDLKLVKPEYVQELYNEVRLLQELDHPNIIRAYETFKLRRKSISIVLELCTGGDLYTRSPYSELQAAKLLGKILSAVAYMHKKNIIHRDLKFENIMYESPNPLAEIKIIDFGLSKKYLHPGAVFTERVGTVYTMAPQVLQGVYTTKADIWSCGVIAFMILSGKKPFWGETKQKIVNKIMRGRISFRSSSWDNVSIEAKDFVRCLMKIDPDHRFSAEQALNAPWLRKEFKLSDRMPDESIMNDVNGSIIRYADSGEFKRLALNVIARKSTTQEIFEYRKAFDQYDVNNDGTISYDEFKSAITQFKNADDAEIKKMFECLDVNKNGIIYYTEFLAATLEAQGRIEERRLAEAFDQLDCDDTGYISKSNLCTVLGKKCSNAYVDELIASIDIDRDGKISYDDFLNAFGQRTNQDIKSMYATSNFASQNSDESEIDETMLTEDHPIPGGKHDTQR